MGTDFTSLAQHDFATSLIALVEARFLGIQ